MDINMQDILNKITDFVQNETNTETVIGKEFKLGEFSCVPVIRFGTGFGTGGGGGTSAKNEKGEGLGAGVGVGVEPIGFLVTRNDEISFISTSHSRGLAAAMEKAPELIEKYFEKKNKESAHTA
jgi:uncharacterized spore protein YtfJ